MPSDFQIWEGIFLTFDLAEQKKVEMGFSSNRYISQAKIAASESFVAIAENKRIPLFHKQRFTLLPITISFLLTINLFDLEFKLQEARITPGPLCSRDRPWNSWISILLASSPDNDLKDQSGKS